MAVFTARSAASSGISRSNLRSRRFEHLAHGLWADEQLVGVARLKALTEVLPESAVFCGSSALEILDLPRLGPRIDCPELLVPAPGHPP